MARRTQEQRPNQGPRFVTGGVWTKRISDNRHRHTDTSELFRKAVGSREAYYTSSGYSHLHTTATTPHHHTDRFEELLYSQVRMRVVVSLA